MIRPITVTEPANGRLLSGGLPQLRRPIGKSLEAIKLGDRLWVREPFHLASEFDGIAPTVAAGRGAAPVFATEFGPGTTWPNGYGRRRMARTLPKIWHRHHLVVTLLLRQPLQAITESEILAEGYPDRDAWISAWDKGVTMVDFRDAAQRRWHHNPTVLLIGFDRVAAPVPCGCPIHD